MHVSKWGDSLAIRLPASVVAALGLKEGDEIEIRVAGSRCFEVTRDQSRKEAPARLCCLEPKMPPRFRFDRDAIYDE